MTGTPLWGPETAKALENFSGCDESGFFSKAPLASVPRELIRAYGEVKLAALEGIQETENHFEPRTMEALRKAAIAVIRGHHDDAFPLPLAQGGAGTSLHMNLNEVLSTLVACELGAEKGPDPIEDLALYQSTNDTFASAGVIVAFRIAESLEQGTITLQERLVTLETKFDQVLLTGRTELQDALPMRLGSVFGAWAGAVERDRWRLSKVTERVREVPLGGSALGTGFGAPRRYAHAAERHLRRITGLPFCRSQNMMDGVALKDGLAEVGGALRIAASNWIRIAGDLLSYSSAALGEIHHPNLQFGSSMMPDKTNPVLLERCRGIALSALGEADKIDLYTREGQFQLNAYLPFLLRSLLRCADECLIAQSDLLRFLDSMTVDQERMERNLAGSPAILNALMPLIGYRRLKDLAWVIHQEAPENLQELARDLAEKTDIPLRTLTQALSADRLTGPPKEQS